MATVSPGRTVWSVLSTCDTPRHAEGFSPRGAELPHARQAELAAGAWRSLVPALAQTPHVRTSSDGGRRYPAKHSRPLPSEPPASQPCVIPVYTPASGSGRLLALDLDASRGDIGHQAAALGQLLGRLGARYIADASPVGVHLYVLFAEALPWLELRDLCRAIALRFPAVDPAPMASLGGQISPPGSRHKSGSWRLLAQPLEEALEAVEHPNGPEVWSALLAEFAAELQAAEDGVGEVQGHDVTALSAEQDDVGVPWIPRLGGRAPLGAELDRAARTGRSPGRGRSEARMAILASAAARGWRLADVLEAVSSGTWKGLPDLYYRASGVRPQWNGHGR